MERQHWQREQDRERHHERERGYQRARERARERLMEWEMREEERRRQLGLEAEPEYGEVWFLCQTCWRKIRRSIFLAHQSEIHGLLNYECAQCKNRFKRFNDLVFHQEYCHHVFHP